MVESMTKSWNCAAPLYMKWRALTEAAVDLRQRETADWLLTVCTGGSIYYGVGVENCV